jgi:hypothetical protein
MDRRFVPIEQYIDAVNAANAWRRVAWALGAALLLVIGAIVGRF